jgi:hypothetical protein
MVKTSFECRICSQKGIKKGFTLNKNLNQHIRKFHQDDNKENHK